MCYAYEYYKVLRKPVGAAAAAPPFDSRPSRSVGGFKSVRRICTLHQRVASQGHLRLLSSSCFLVHCDWKCLYFVSSVVLQRFPLLVVRF